MNLVKPSIKFAWMTENPLLAIEKAGRTCYKSENKIDIMSAPKFVRKLLERGHHAMIEHASASYRVICDRGVTHEIVRHRLFSYAQESTRYCNYKGGVTFIIPPWIILQEGAYTSFNFLRKTVHIDGLLHSWKAGPAAELWAKSLFLSEKAYTDLLGIERWTPQQVRSVLPNSLKTEIVMTANVREWRHFFNMRCTPQGIPNEKKQNGIYYGANAPHPQMQEVANMLVKDMASRIPVLFDEFLS